MLASSLASCPTTATFASSTTPVFSFAGPPTTAAFASSTTLAFSFASCSTTTSFASSMMVTFSPAGRPTTDDRRLHLPCVLLPQPPHRYAPVVFSEGEDQRRRVLRRLLSPRAKQGGVPPQLLCLQVKQGAQQWNTRQRTRRAVHRELKLKFHGT
ncbi:hypothetical protein B0H14DRAFT_2564962 [Mycena olivaceomarginata]|nr:hypothetical protein B0H14DRAFT_2564962 [Mycena olivaceomarginata]